MDIKLEQIRAFGPSILKVKIPDELVDQLNQYVDQVIVDEKKSKKLDHGKRLVADVKQEFVIETDFTKNSGWGNFLGSCVKAWIKRDMEKEITKFQIIQTWIVRQFQNEFNPIHWHGGHISGAGFLKVPKNWGNFDQEISAQDPTHPGPKAQRILGIPGWYMTQVGINIIQSLRAYRWGGKK